MDAVVTSLFAAGPSTTLSFSEFVLRALVAFVLGQVIGWAYQRSHGVLSYSQTYVQSLVLLVMVVALVVEVIGDSLARAFGMAAALAIVRFRTPVKDTRDAAFLFLAVAIGMTVGTDHIGVAFAATFIVAGAAIWLHQIGFGSRTDAEGMLRFRFEGDDAIREQVVAVLRQYCRVFQLTAARTSGPGGPEELVYDVTLKRSKEADVFVRALQGTGAVTGVALLPAARTGES